MQEDRPTPRPVTKRPTAIPRKFCATVMSAAPRARGMLLSMRPFLRRTVRGGREAGGASVAGASASAGGLGTGKGTREATRALMRGQLGRRRHLRPRESAMPLPVRAPMADPARKLLMTPSEQGLLAPEAELRGKELQGAVEDRNVVPEFDSSHGGNGDRQEDRREGGLHDGRPLLRRLPAPRQAGPLRRWQQRKRHLPSGSAPPL